MEFFDRVPTYPGRVTMTPVPGKANTYDMVRADEPVVAGTPVNKVLFESFNGDIDALKKLVADTLYEMTQRVTIGSLAIGTVFSLYENGIMTPFIKLTDNYESSGRVLVVRGNCITENVLVNPSETNYENSRVDLWLNNEYISTLDTATQGVLNTVSVKVSTSNGVGGISRKAFLLSLREYQMTSSAGIPSMGNALAYFSPVERRIATLNGTPTNHWTRSNDRLRDTAAYITPEGDHLLGTPSTFIAGIRPAFTLPVDFEVTAGIPSTANTMATAEVI